MIGWLLCQFGQHDWRDRKGYPMPNVIVESVEGGEACDLIYRCARCPASTRFGGAR